MDELIKNCVETIGIKQELSCEYEGLIIPVSKIKAPPSKAICVLTHMRSSAYNSLVAWDIDLHPEVVDWLQKLSVRDYENVIAAIDALKIDGPNLGRPFADHIKNSKHKNMKELRPPGRHFRLLFAFDPTRRAIILVAGDKQDDWLGWYSKSIPIADKRFNKHLNDLKEGKN